MEKLINIKEQNGIKVCSARELHNFLEVGTRFRDWIERMFEYGFIENQDYTRVLNFERGGNQAKEYALTLDCAKEISMLQRNEKGKQARQYFIEVEKKARNISQDPLQLLKLAVSELEAKEHKILLQQNVIKQSAPKVEYFDEVLQSKSTYTTNQIAKELGMSAIGLNRFLKDNRIQYKQNETWVLYSKYQNKGFTKTKTHTYYNSQNEKCTSMQTVWTETGRLFIHEQISVTA
tara:strand:+ start:17368 stop:18069 length:702 start_codon:yes stop_codon:yes gene_type:complete